MNRLLGVALLVAGGVVFSMGWQARQSLGSRLNQLIQGSPSNNAMLLMIGGGVLALAGLALLLRRWR